MEAVYKKDLKSLFNGMTGWVLCAFVTFIIGLYFTALSLVSGYAEIAILFNSITFIFLIIVPLLTMRSMVEERRFKTDILLFTSPCSVAEIVLGKYFALLTIYAMPMAVACTLPLIMSMFGTVSMARSYSSVLAFFLLGAALIAIGMFIGGFTQSPVIAAVGTFGTLLILYLLPSVSSLISGTPFASALALTVLAFLAAFALHAFIKSVALCGGAFVIVTAIVWVVFFTAGNLLPGVFSSVLGALSLFDRYTPFLNGIFDVSGIVYFVSVAAFFVFLTCQGIHSRRRG